MKCDIRSEGSEWISLLTLALVCSACKKAGFRQDRTTQGVPCRCKRKVPYICTSSNTSLMYARL